MIGYKIMQQKKVHLPRLVFPFDPHTSHKNWPARRVKVDTPVPPKTKELRDHILSYALSNVMLPTTLIEGN